MQRRRHTQPCPACQRACHGHHGHCPPPPGAPSCIVQGMPPAGFEALSLAHTPLPTAVPHMTRWAHAALRPPAAHGPDPPPPRRATCTLLHVHSNPKCAMEVRPDPPPSHWGRGLQDTHTCMQLPFPPATDTFHWVRIAAPCSTVPCSTGQDSTASYAQLARTCHAETSPGAAVAPQRNAQPARSRAPTPPPQTNEPQGVRRQEDATTPSRRPRQSAPPSDAVGPHRPDWLPLIALLLSFCTTPVLPPRPSANVLACPAASPPHP